MNITDIGFIVPTRDNLEYIKLAYNSLRDHYPENWIIILDDASKDGTGEFLELLEEDDRLIVHLNEGEERVGHTVLYDIGFQTLGTLEVPLGMIFHADMVASAGMAENLLKWWEPKTVVCSTRIEPPLHPEGPEKIIRDFGKFPEEFKSAGFEIFSNKLAQSYQNQISVGIFAPWLISIEDMKAVGGHDYLFAPMELEDSDIFNRWYNAGYSFVQSWDSLVYHFTSRGSRFKDGDITKDSEEYTKLREIKIKEWQRRWRQPVSHDPMMLPIVSSVHVTHGFNVPEDYRHFFDAIDTPGPVEFHFPEQFNSDSHDIIIKNQNFFISKQHIKEVVVNGVKIIVNKKVLKDMIHPEIKNIL